jgi:hypothetical protein
VHKPLLKLESCLRVLLAAVAAAVAALGQSPQLVLVQPRALQQLAELSASFEIVPGSCRRF